MLLLMFLMINVYFLLIFFMVSLKFGWKIMQKLTEIDQELEVLV